MDFEKEMAGLLGFDSAEDKKEENLEDGTGDDGAGDDGDGDAGTGTGAGDDANTETGDDGNGDDGTGDDGNGDDGDAGAGDDGAGDDGSGSGKTKILPLEDDKKITGVDFETSLAEKSGGRFKTYADIEAAITDAGENAFATDMVKKLNDYVKSGGRTEDFLKTQTVNFKEMSDIEAIKEMEVLSNDGLTNEEINLLIEEDYGLGENATEREKMLAKIKIKKNGEAARKELIKYQEKWAAAPEATQEQKQAATAQEVETWRNELSEAVDKNEDISFKIGEKEFKFKPSDEAKGIVKESYDLSKFWERYKTDNRYDVNKFVKDMYILNNIEEISKSLVTFGEGKGTEKIVDDIKNVDLTGKDNKGGSGTKISINDQIGEAIFS